MRLALECPVRLLEMVQPFADFDWLLGEEFEKEGYVDYFKKTGNPKFLDNSVNELGEPLSVAKMKELSEEFPGCMIVSPDWIGDSQKTIEAYRECIGAFKKERIVGVIQGQTYQDILTCLNTYGPGWIAVPYDVCSSKEDPPWLMALRRALVVAYVPNDRFIHLLGFNSLEEFFWYRERTNVVSIDTGVPVMLGLNGMDILEPLESKAKPTLTEMNKIELTQKGWTAIIRNIALLRKYIQ